MAVYVDDIQDWTRVARMRGLRHTHWAHLTADGREELHEFASRLGLRRTWFQDHVTRWHYDVTPNKRAQAIRLGAVAIDQRQMAHLTISRQGGGNGEGTGNDG